MKKITTRPDGSKEEVEGTAEEIAAYEDARTHASAYGAVEPLYYAPKLRPHAEHCPCAGAWWGIVPPTCTCGAALWIQPSYTVTIAGTHYGDDPALSASSTSVSIGCGFDGHSNVQM